MLSSRSIATGYHFTGPIALRHSLSTTLPDIRFLLDLYKENYTLIVWESQQICGTVWAILIQHFQVAHSFSYRVSTDYLLGLENIRELDLSGLTEEEIQALLNLIKSNEA